MLLGASGATPTKFKADKIYKPSFAIGSSAFCDTYNSFDTGSAVLECRPAAQSDDKTQDKLVRTDPATLCGFTTYNDASASSTTGIKGTSVAK
jgi:hypothetical protein